METLTQTRWRKQLQSYLEGEPVPWGFWQSLTEHTYLSRQHVANVLQGRRGYSATTAKELCRLLDIDREWLGRFIDRVKQCNQ